MPYKNAADRAAGYKRWYAIHHQPKPRRSLEERFWSKVDRSGECWMWVASLASTGYGQFYDKPRRRTPIGAHRVAWELANGPIPAGLQVLHRCDNPPCVRPDHLFIGTVSDNMRDMYAKGRRAGRVA
jgi:hypothetical protein